LITGWRFDNELMHLQCHMQANIIGVLKPFLAFVSSFQPCVAHNMLIFMLDLWFKNMQLIDAFVGLELTM
jgi:hypothetical protein